MPSEIFGPFPTSPSSLSLNHHRLLPLSSWSDWELLEAVKTSLPLVTPAVFFPLPLLHLSFLLSTQPSIRFCVKIPLQLRNPAIAVWRYYIRNMFYQYFSIYDCTTIFQACFLTEGDRASLYASIYSKPKRRSMQNLSFSPKVSYFVTQLLIMYTIKC